MNILGNNFFDNCYNIDYYRIYYTICILNIYKVQINRNDSMKEKLTMFCHGARNHMERFMEICLLLLLCQETSHGYTLAEQLNDFGFSKEDLNMGSLYRTLRKMEKDALVSSCWEEGKQGPKKRVYQITEAGKASLKNWIVLLKKRRKRISKLINYYEKRTIK